MLKLIVTLKQAPKSNMVSMQEGTNIVVRNPEDAMLTFDDCNALELAMTLKDAMETTYISPHSASETTRQRKFCGNPWLSV